MKYLLDLAFIRPDGVPVIVLSFYGMYKSGEVKLDEDSVEYTWVTAKEAVGHDLIHSVLSEIEMIDKILMSGF